MDLKTFVTYRLLREAKRNPARYDMMIKGQIEEEKPSNDNLFDKLLTMLLANQDTSTDFLIIDAPNRSVKAWKDAVKECPEDIHPILKSDYALAAKMGLSAMGDEFVHQILDTCEQDARYRAHLNTLRSHGRYFAVADSLAANEEDALIVRSIDKIENAPITCHKADWARTAAFTALAADSKRGNVIVIEKREPFATMFFRGREFDVDIVRNEVAEHFSEIEKNCLGGYLHTGPWEMQVADREEFKK